MRTAHTCEHQSGEGDARMQTMVDTGFPTRARPLEALGKVVSEHCTGVPPQVCRKPSVVRLAQMGSGWRPEPTLEIRGKCL